MKPFLLLLALALLMFPSRVFAQDTLTDLLTEIGNLIALTIPVLITLGLAIFLFGLVKYLAKAGDEQATEEGKRIMFWGVITLFVMVSVWGLVSILQGAFFGASFDFTGPEGGIPQLDYQYSTPPDDGGGVPPPPGGPGT